VRHLKDLRQLFTVGVYLTLLGLMLFVPSARHPLVLIAACAFGWFTMLVNHNVMHLGIFESAWANRAFRVVLSFCALFPVSSVIPSHNLVHHYFDDDGQPDWASPDKVRFGWNLLNILHFPNVVGPITFNGVNAWGKVRGRAEFRRQYTIESIVAFGGTAVLLAFDFWGTLFFIMVPQLFSARSFLRINLIQHDGADVSSEWNHSRNFVGPLMNFFWLNGGYHTIHHNRAALHWAELASAHQAECARRIHPSLVERSFTWYLVRTYLLQFGRPAAIDVAAAERQAPQASLAPRDILRAQAEAAAS
jgi:fatty acid desaturase